MSKRYKIFEIWKLIRAKHCALLLADSEEDISWAINTLRAAEEQTNATE